MLLFDGFLGVVAFALWIFAIIDVLTTRRDRVRTLPKYVWLLVVVLFAALGAVAWLVLGRSWNREGALVGAARPGRLRASTPDDDPDFLASLAARLQEQRRREHPEDPSA